MIGIPYSTGEALLVQNMYGNVWESDFKCWIPQTLSNKAFLISTKGSAGLFNYWAQWF